MTTLEADREEMETTEQQEILDRLRLFVSQGRTAEDMADRGSLDRAADIVQLYEAKEWLAELPELKTRRSRGRPVDPESFSRFTKWLEGKTSLKSRTAYQLRDAYEVETNYLRAAQIKPAGEHGLRPLKWLVKNDYIDAIPGVWDRACELAGGQSPMSPIVRQALNEWKKETFPKVERPTSEKRGGRAAVDKWLRDAHRLMEEYPELFVDAVNKVEEEAEQYFTGKMS